MSERIKYVTDESFQSQVLEARGPAVVDFWAPWCGPCRMLSPVIESLAEEQPGVTFFKMNTDENPETPDKLGIRGIPTLVFFLEGQEVDRLVGVAPKEYLQERLEALTQEAQAK